MKHSFGVFFAWHGLDSCFGTEALLFMGSKGHVRHLSACFLLGMGSNLAGVSVFSDLTLTRL